MYLKNLEISGFKSFGKKDSLEFSSPITAIVGPNGSGKSNIAEAFRFVLGEQSIKSMRGKRGEDLIWNGSQTVPRASRASVKVTFDNRGRALPIDFEEVILERTVYRDSVNEYFLNGSRVRLKDILELLASAHIGASGHHIISQGEADKILNTNPKERKEMIEDALGLKIYQYKRLESERKLEKTQENIKSVESLRREIAPHLRFLKKQIEKIEKARSTKEELRVLYLRYLNREHTYLSITRKELEDRRRGPENDLKRLEGELVKAKKILEGSHSRDEKTERIFSLEQNIKKTREEKDALTRDLGRIEGEIASNERVIERQKTIEREKGEGSVSLRDVEVLAGDLESKAETASSDPASLREIIKTILHSVRDFISSHRQTVSPIVSDSQKEIELLNDKKREIEKRIVSLKNNEEGFEKEYRILKEGIEKEKDTSRDAEKEVFRIMAQEREVRSELTMVSNDEMTFRRADEDFKRELTEAGVLIGAAILEYKTFVLKDEDGKEIAAKTVMEEPRDIQEDRRRAIEKLKIRLEDMGGGGEETLKEFKETSERDEFLARELTDLEKSAMDLKTLIEELEEKLNVEFKDGVSRINHQFKDFFTLMFGGGTASLSVVEEKKRKRSDTDIILSEDEESSMSVEEEIEEGIEISVSLPRKKIKGLMMLSGGERALTSIALLFAVSQVNPPPFVILDETDAALDEANSRKYGDMIENLSKKSQLILITHNRETMSRAGVLYGVTMDSGGMSKLLSVKFDEAVVVAK
ncbi:MAG: AAA family ATPase [Patescibacteria group bacterium]|nr:AAA family ATPase [bacterium]MDZ4240592.1 AAA family ATPase [Patescibacteria group bacterium]